MQRTTQLVAILLLTGVMTSVGAAQISAKPTFQPRRSMQMEEAISQVTTLLKDFLANVKEPAMHEKFWANDVVYVSSTGKLRTKQQIVNSVRTEAAEPASPSTSFAAEDITVRAYGTVAVVNFTLVAHEGPPSGPRHEGETRHFRNSGVFRRGPQGWQVVSWQSTAAPEPPVKSTAAE